MVYNPTLQEIANDLYDCHGYKKIPIGEEEFKQAKSEGETPTTILSCERLLKTRCSKEFIEKHPKYFRQPKRKLTPEEKRIELINETIDDCEYSVESLFELLDNFEKIETENKQVCRVFTKVEKQTCQMSKTMSGLLKLMKKKGFQKEKIQGVC